MSKIRKKILTPADTIIMIAEIKNECRGPISVSYEYDPTPTAEERLKKILEIIEFYESN